MNGVESEEKKMLKQISGDPASPTSPVTPATAGGQQVEDDDSMEDDFEEVDEQAGTDDSEALPAVSEDLPDTPAGSTRSKARQRNKT